MLSRDDTIAKSREKKVDIVGAVETGAYPSEKFMTDQEAIFFSESGNARATKNATKCNKGPILFRDAVGGGRLRGKNRRRKQ